MVRAVKVSRNCGVDKRLCTVEVLPVPVLPTNRMCLWALMSVLTTKLLRMVSTVGTNTL